MYLTRANSATNPLSDLVQSPISLRVNLRYLHVIDVGRSCVTLLYLEPRIACCSRDLRIYIYIYAFFSLRISLARLKQETAQQQPPQATDITRQAALLAKKLMQQSSDNAENFAPCVKANVNPILATTKRDGATSTQGLDRHGDGAVRLDRGRDKRGFVSRTNTTTALPHRAGRKGWTGSSGEGGFAKRKTCRGKPIQLRVGNGEMVGSDEDSTGMIVDGVLEARTGLGDFVAVERAGRTNVLETEGRKDVGSKPRRRRKGLEGKDRGVQVQDEKSSFQSGVGNEEHAFRGETSVTGTGGRSGLSGSGGAEGVLTEDAAALQIEACWRGFLGRCAAKHELRSVLLNALRKVGGGRVSKVRRTPRIKTPGKGYNFGIGPQCMRTSWQYLAESTHIFYIQVYPYTSPPSTSPDQTPRPDQSTATLCVQLFGVIPIPSHCCWLFTFLCAAPWFKAMALGDVAEGDRLQLNHALRTATQSRRPLRQLPPQVQTVDAHATDSTPRFSCFGGSGYCGVLCAQ